CVTYEQTGVFSGHAVGGGVAFPAGLTRFCGGGLGIAANPARLARGPSISLSRLFWLLRLFWFWRREGGRRLRLVSGNRIVRDSNQEQQLHGAGKANQNKAHSYCLDPWYVTPKFGGPFLYQTVNAKHDHRDAAESDHVSQGNSLHGQLLPLPPPIARGIGGALGILCQQAVRFAHADRTLVRRLETLEAVLNDCARRHPGDRSLNDERAPSSKAGPLAGLY